MLICCSQYRKNPKYKMNKKKHQFFDYHFNRASFVLGKALLPSLHRNGQTDTHMTEVTIIFGARNSKRQVHNRVVTGQSLFFKVVKCSTCVT